MKISHLRGTAVAGIAAVFVIAASSMPGPGRHAGTDDQCGGQTRHPHQPARKDHRGHDRRAGRGR